MEVTFRENIEGLKELERTLKKIGKFQIRVGILGAGQYEDSDQTIAHIGATHEFGSITANIPERSFLRNTLEIEKLKELIEFIVEILKAVMTGKTKENQAANKIGAKATALVGEAFSTGGFGKWEQLKESTIAAKDSAAILIETGILRRSITFDVKF